MKHVFWSAAALFALVLASGAAADVTTHNDDSCDVAVMPAATLLLPYFEVDLDDPQGETTLFSITNVTAVDRVVRVTLWTDRGFPVFTFDIYLTGYDVQSINLYHILARGLIAPDAGTGTALWFRRGQYSRVNGQLDLTRCDRLPGVLDDAYVLRMQRAFVDGTVPDLGAAPPCGHVGNAHQHAVGYATFDVVGACGPETPLDAAYWSSVIRHDNVLTGEYQQVNRADNSGQGGPLVHIRAIPDGGAAPPPFERTFYARFQSPDAPNRDGRQPLPSRFAARWLDGPDSDTTLKVWREGTLAAATCDEYASQTALAATEVVVFDENENATGTADDLALPLVSRIDVGDALPQLANGATAGWIYLNLDRDWRDDTATQNWVIASTRALGRFSVDLDAVALGNGCAPDVRPSEVTRSSGAPIAPSPREAESCDLALLPAATLLLPYFAVDLDDAQDVTTLFTVTNVDAAPRIARVTLWTDYAYPVLTFNLPLGGYAVQSISLHDVLARGVLPADCDGAPRQLAPEVLVRLRDAFVEGIAPECIGVGNIHENAVGYATVDLVRNCSANGPLERAYWTGDLAYDNVLIGDAQQLRVREASATGNTMVHIRAVPDADFPRTFYTRFQSAQRPRLDARQPLPHLFAARWMEGGSAQMITRLKIWRESATGSGSRCGNQEDNASLVVPETVRFDEEENAVAENPPARVLPLIRPITTPAASETHIADASVFPQMTNGAVAGWMYVNLADGDSQSWIAPVMQWRNGYAVEGDAAALGNGCSAPTPMTEVTTGAIRVGPAPDRRR